MYTTKHLPSGFLFIVAFFFSSISFSQQEYNVMFEIDEHEFTHVEYNRFIDFYKDNLQAVLNITLIGHTDSDADDEHNQKLSKRRVNTVKTALVDIGYAPGNISINHMGEKKPLNKNNTKEEKRLNRRVTMTWTKPQPIIEKEKLGNIQDLYDLLAQQKQSFCIDPNRDTILYLEQGTIIGIPAHAFKTSSTECVTFKAKEAYKYSDMLMENLSTMSNGRMLETGGMVYTEATDENGKELAIAKDKELTIMMPTNSIDENMRLFYGERDPHNQMNWTTDDNDRGSNGIEGINLSACERFGEWDYFDECEKCGILFCRLFGRIDETIKGAFNKDVRAGNKEFRQCQRNLRRRVNSSNGLSKDITTSDSAGCANLMKEYGVENLQALRDTLQKLQDARYQSLFEQYGVENRAQLADTLRKIREKELQQEFDDTQERLENNEGNMEDLLYYVARTNKLGWINCDSFYDVKNKIDMVTDLRSNQETDCKTIFKKRRSIMRSVPKNNRHGFLRIPKGIAVWILALKYRSGQAYLYLESTKTKTKIDDIKFRPVSLEELKIELKKID